MFDVLDGGLAQGNGAVNQNHLCGFNGNVRSGSDGHTVIVPAIRFPSAVSTPATWRDSFSTRAEEASQVMTVT
ncbi:MAG: hypothetical protein MR828_09310 [Clostridiales bacterium]|nr:hypothetical protein [Clostridiales bacterium]